MISNWTPLLVIQRKNNDNCLGRPEKRENSSKNVIIYGMRVNKDLSPNKHAKEDFNKMRKILSDLKIKENLIYLDIDQKETKTRLLKYK